MYERVIDQIPSPYLRYFVLVFLPLVDGVFISIVISTGLSTIEDAIFVGLFIFGGIATSSLIISDFGDCNTRLSIVYITTVHVIVLFVAIGQVMIANTIQDIIRVNVITVGAVIALISLAVSISPDIKFDSSFSGSIIGISLLFSIDYLSIPTISITYVYSDVLLYTTLSVFIGYILSIVVILLREKFSKYVNVIHAKRITAIGLILIALNIIGYIPSLSIFVAVIIGIIVMVFEQFSST